LMAQLGSSAAQESGFSIGYQRLVSYFVFAASVFALALASGVGLSQAAEGSLPGDWLYPIKTKVAEPVARALTSDRRQQFDLEAEILEKRLHEAETLIKEKELDEDRKEQIKIEIKRQTAKAAAVIQDEPEDTELENEIGNRSEETKTDKEDEGQEDEEIKKKDDENKWDEDDREQKLEKILEQHQETIEELESKLDHKKSSEAKEKEVRNDDEERHNDRGRD